MFLITYLRRELRRRMRQAILIALGLAVGIGLVVTVTAASAGVKKAQADVLKSLYGVGTDVTVTGKPPRAPTSGSAPPQGATTFQVGPGGARVCQNGKCENAAGKTIEHLTTGNYGPISQAKVAEVAGLKAHHGHEELDRRGVDLLGSEDVGVVQQRLDRTKRIQRLSALQLLQRLAEFVQVDAEFDEPDHRHNPGDRRRKQGRHPRD